MLRCTYKRPFVKQEREDTIKIYVNEAGLDGVNCTVRSASRCAQSEVYRDRPRTLNELQTAVTAFIRSISQADVQKVFANKIKWVQACTDAPGRHFQHLLKVHSDFPNALYFNVLGWCPFALTWFQCC
jgi:hypothetical protein